MPVFRDLVAAGTPQVTLGTDLGQQLTRINVGVYNAGTEPATALIEVRRACNGTVVASRSVIVPANTIVQIGGFGNGSSAECSTPDLGNAAAWMRYVIVTADQPSFSYVANLNENVPATTPVNIIPPIGLAVANNARY